MRTQAKCYKDESNESSNIAQQVQDPHLIEVSSEDTAFVMVSLYQCILSLDGFELKIIYGRYFVVVDVFKPEPSHSNAFAL
jgi:hypothetical protein